jgi:SPP1 family phage portal protein
MFKSGNISYSVDDTANDDLFNSLTDIYNKNHEDNHNAKLGEYQSKYGIAFEIIYNKQDDKNKTLPSFAVMKPQEIIPIYDYSIEKNIIAVIRFYQINTVNNDSVYNIELYLKDTIKYYKYNKTQNTLEFLNEDVNIYEDIPFVVYKNNENYIADYEPVKSLIILYDKLISDSANEMDRFAAAYLIFKNYILGGNEEESRQKMARLKSLRVFEIDNDGEIKFLTKEIPVAFFQECKITIEENIIKHSHVPDFKNESFGTSSGIALKYKLIDFENLCAHKEAYFKEGLDRRIELISKFLKIQNEGLEGLNIDIKFTRNIPDNITDAIDNAVKVWDKLSLETVLSLLPFIKNAQEEIDRIEKEKEEKQSLLNIDNMFNEPIQDDANNNQSGANVDNDKNIDQENNSNSGDVDAKNIK